MKITLAIIAVISSIAAPLALASPAKAGMSCTGYTYGGETHVNCEDDFETQNLIREQERALRKYNNRIPYIPYDYYNYPVR